MTITRVLAIIMFVLGLVATVADIRLSWPTWLMLGLIGLAADVWPNRHVV